MIVKTILPGSAPESVPLPAILAGEGAITGPVSAAVQSMIFHHITEKTSCRSTVCPGRGNLPHWITGILWLVAFGVLQIHCPISTFLPSSSSTVCAPGAFYCSGHQKAASLEGIRDRSCVCPYQHIVLIGTNHDFLILLCFS